MLFGKVAAYTPGELVSSTINIHAYSDALVILGTAGIVAPIVRRWGLNLLGYLGAGALLSPLGLGSFVDSFPLLHWVSAAAIPRHNARAVPGRKIL